MNPSPCPKCGGPMDEGNISTSQGVNYVSNQQQGLLRVMTPARRARACLQCGYLELYLDPQELKSKLPA